MKFVDENGEPTKAEVFMTPKGIQVTFERSRKLKGASTRVKTITDTVIVPTARFKDRAGNFVKYGLAPKKIEELTNYYQKVKYFAILFTTLITMYVEML